MDVGLGGLLSVRAECEGIMSHEEFPPIQQRLMRFVRERFQPGYNHYNVSKLVGDASSRQYYRYVTDDGDSYILAAYPEPFDTSSFSYRQIYDLLQEIAIPVPEIIAIDSELGIVLQEDLGNESLQKTLRNADDRQKVLLLKEAIGHILTIQEKGTQALKPEYEGYGLAFDEEKLNWEFWFFARHYLDSYRGRDLPERDLLIAEFEEISALLASYPRLLCHRDFHVRNMMVKKGILYVIDFQDARWGPPSYDLVSLLKDSLDLAGERVDELVDYYCFESKRRGFFGLTDEHFSPDEFRRQFNLMCVQRLLKALGTYAYQILVRDNFIYEQYMAGSLHRTLLALSELPEFTHTRRLIEAELGAL